ncbi:MAG: OmpA family protein, partial [Spongiibacter sp.]
KTPLELYGVNFATNTAVLDAPSTVVLRQVARVLAAVPNIRVEVVGHTDDVGAEAFNLGLSKRRALAVIEFLVAEGISVERFEARGLGESSPKVPISGKQGAELEAARRDNRRVELRALK